MEHWSDDLTHDKLITPEAKTVLGEYTTSEEFMAAGLEAKKMVGSPFRLPKSLESLPDDKVREELTSQVSELFGADGFLKGMTKSEEDLADIDFAAGYKNAKSANKEYVAALKAFAVDKKLPKETVKDLVGFTNQFNQGLLNNEEKRVIDEADAIKETLTVMCGSKEAVGSSYDNVRKLFQNHCGITTQEYESVGKDFVEKVLMKNAVMSKALFNLADGIVVEGETEGTLPGGEKKPETMVERQNKELPGITSRLWPKK